MRTMNLAIVLCLFMGSAVALADAAWEVRKMPSGQCEVVRVDPKPSAGTRVAGPYKTKQRAEEERNRLRKTPKCAK